MLAESDP